MPSSPSTSKVGYIQEVDDMGNLTEGVTYARSEAPSPVKKDRMNIGKKKAQSPTPANAYTDSDSTVNPRRRESRPTRTSRRERPPSPPPKKSSNRPIPTHAKTEPAPETHRHRRSRDPRDSRDSRDARDARDTRDSRDSRDARDARDARRDARDARNARESRDTRDARAYDEASYYGVKPPMAIRDSSRPRSKTAAPRPSSMYRPPPVANTRYHMMQHQQQPSAMPPPPPPSVFPGGMPPPGYVPQQWAHVPPSPMPIQGPPPPAAYAMMPPPPPQSFTSQHDYMPPPPQGPPRQLQQRFNIRPQTSLGHRALPPAVNYGAPETYDPEVLSGSMRRLSLAQRPNIDEELSRHEQMRPRSARPSVHHASPFAPPPSLPPTREQDVAYGYPEDFDEPEDPYYEPSVQYDAAPMSHVSRIRRQSFTPAPLSYEPRPYTTEIAHANGGNRRHSYYGDQSVSSGSGFEDKMRVASAYQEAYQEEVGGSMPLTAEMLREASRGGGGARSRSTRSSGSRDESDWRQSATTRTTRSSNEEDVTIRVKGQAYVRYGEAEMQCQDGTINISRVPSRRLVSSDKSSYIDADDRRSRAERPALRNRAASQTGSVYAPLELPYSYGGYDYEASPFDPRPQWL